MKLYTKILLVALTSMPVALMAGSDLSDKNVKYIGDPTAKRICSTVIEDDAVRLQQLLKEHRRHILYGYRFHLNGRAVAGSFTCNKLALLPFADKIGSQNVSNYLRGGIVEMEELVSSIN